MYILDPTAEARPERVAMAPRPVSLEHATIGLLSNGKPITSPFFDKLESMLRAHWNPTQILRLSKANYSKPAEPDLIRELTRCRLIVTGVGD